MYVSSYSPIQSSYGSIGMQGLQSGNLGFPIQQGFSGALGMHPLQSGTFSAAPYNLVSYSFNPW